MVKHQIRLTYFTPTYNREKLLPNLYNSLLNQTNKNFIWLIIDDGSQDNTEELVKKWKLDNKLNITYIKKENGGKHTAIDLSNQVCETEFICCVDSDDLLTPDATNILYSKFNLCQEKTCCGLVGPKLITNEQSNGHWNINTPQIYFYDLDKKFGVLPETTLVLKTEIAKKYHFPNFPDEKFVTESVYYQQFFYNYTLATFNEIIYIAEYQPDGYTNMGLNLFVKNPYGYAYALKQNAYYSIIEHKSFRLKLKTAIMYYGWIKFMKIDKDFTTDYKIKSFYHFLGKLMQPFSALIFRKKVKKN